VDDHDGEITESVAGRDLRPSLRWTDWRFLLPSPVGGSFEHLVVVGGPAGLAERVVEAGWARRVSCAIPKGRSADAVVILRDAGVTLGDAVHSLRAGGALYYEVDRRVAASRSVSPRAMQRALLRAGMCPTGSYWAAPNFDDRLMYLPLGAPEVFRWYLASKFVASTPERRLLEPGLRLLARFRSDAVDLFARQFAVTGVVPSGARPLPSLLGHPVLPPELRHSPLRPLVLTPGGDELNRVILLPFLPGASRPALVLKLSRLPERNLHTENEQRVLVAVRALLDEAMRRTVPRPIGVFEWNGLAVSAESAVPGRLLLSSTGRWGAPLRWKIDDLQTAVSWLIEFHRQAQVRRSPWGETELSRWVEKPLAAYGKAFGVTPNETALFAAVRDRARSLVGASLPIVWEHYALQDQNMSRDRSDIYVVDWEGGGEGMPLFDLFYYAMDWANTVIRLRDEGGRHRCFRALFCEPDPADPHALAIQRAVSRYAVALDIDGRFVPLLLVLMWIVRSLSRSDRQAALGAVGGGRSRNQGIAYVSLLAAHRDQIFARQWAP